MSRELTNPLQSLLSQAARQLPVTTGETEQAGRRYANAGTATVILCDVSSSMDEKAGVRRKFDHLRDALAVTQHDLSIPMIGFATTAFTIPSAVALPEPSGGTAMHLGLEAAAAHRPRRTVVISDGRPDSEEQALVAAERLPGRIDVLYCGPDSDAQAIDFMRRLARIGGGIVIVHDLARLSRPELIAPVRRLLALPAPKGDPS